MADRVLKMHLNHIEAGDVSGKVVNVYDTYANALGYGATGLISTLKAVAPLTGLPTGSAITQVAKTTGVTTDIGGNLLFSVDDASYEYWGRVTSGRVTGPFRIGFGATGP